MDGRLSHQPHHRRQVSEFMSAQRMTLEPRRSIGHVPACIAAVRSLALAAGLIALAVPLSGCGTGALWDKFIAKDDTFVEEPADKLYNEGLYTDEPAQGSEGGVEEIRGSRPPASLFRLGAQIAADVGLFASTMPATTTAASALRRCVTSRCIPGSPDAGLRAIL